MTTKTIPLNIVLNTPAAPEAEAVSAKPTASPAAQVAAQARSEYVAVDSDAEGAGVMAMWNMSGPFDCAKLREAWVNAGLDVDLPLPDAPTPKRALFNTVHKLKSRQFFPRGLGNGGYAFIDESRVDEQRLTHEQALSVCIDKNGALVVSPWDHPRADDVRAEYARQCDAWSATDMGRYFSEQALPALHATSLKRSGGCYYVPAEYVDTYRRAKAAIEKVSASAMYEIPMMTKGDAVRVVLDALLAEATKMADDTADQLADPDALGKRALRTRSRECDAMVAKLVAYEGLLGNALDGIKNRVCDLRGDAVAALLAKD